MKIFTKANTQREVPQSLTQWDFEGVGKRNKGKKYREYAETLEDAKLGVCTGYRISPNDIQLIR